MKTELKAKFLQHLVGKKKDDQGFTLIELLVVIIIIGILSAIALPSFLNQAKKARQSEAKTYVGSLNRGQQAFYTENDAFTTSIDAMGVGVATQTANYTYIAVAGTGTGTEIFAANYSNSANTGSGLKNYGGVVSLRTAGTNSEVTSQAFMCETLNVDTPGIDAIATGATSTSCAAGGKAIK
ncbi:MAG: prepilin-type N-terminal cleavage/methylation domain-containing protein [Nostocales cyanobacterium W4_Combined_metabat2_030]|jgi:prepilin-type N-terminal cleavage/methylation domain-containing protein|nr:prepilin-type N-terminal cleavage/methylation domain-containing protein [Nostocales cyanobacterium W4_Combined_metabat2_030]